MRRFLNALLLVAPLVQAVQAEPTLRLATENLAPYNIVSPDLKEVSGLVADKVLDIMRRANIRYSLAPSGWNRAYELGRTQPDTCVFSTARTPEREPMFKWVGPLAITEWMLFARRDLKQPATSLAELRGVPINTYRSDAINQYLRAQGYMLQESESNEGCVASLLAGRSDYWAAGATSGPMLLNKMNAADRIHALFAFKRNELYLACNPAVPDDMLARMKAAMQQMQDDGSMQRIDALYPH
jgi:polar amino acid transport system substrate-binding protein